MDLDLEAEKESLLRESQLQEVVPCCMSGPVVGLRSSASKARRVTGAIVVICVAASIVSLLYSMRTNLQLCVDSSTPSFFHSSSSAPYLLTRSLSPLPLTSFAYQRFATVCLTPGVNRVLLRDGVVGEMMDIRPWSLSIAAMAPPVSRSLSFCRTLQELFTAVDLGQRLPVRGFGSSHPEVGSSELRLLIQALPANLTESARWAAIRHFTEYGLSYFVPFGCSLRIFSAEEACSVLSQYSHTLVAGDSLTRHTVQGLYSLLSEDVVYGALPPRTEEVHLYGNCTCDGQFSEAKVCRLFPVEAMSLSHPQSYGICRSNLSHRFTFTLKWVGPGPEHWWDDLEWLCTADQRPRIIVLQGCLHYRVNATKVVDELLVPFFTGLITLHRSCRFPLSWRIMWIGVSAPSRSMDQSWPHQSRDRQKAFNSYVSAWLAQLGIPTLHFFNLTLEAATSDGNHYLSEVNMLKASAILNVMHIMQSEDHALDMARLAHVTALPLL